MARHYLGATHLDVVDDYGALWANDDLPYKNEWHTKRKSASKPASRNLPPATHAARCSPGGPGASPGRRILAHGAAPKLAGCR